tara:strand:- start:610 stop:1182 length:573 start_codon:yes stop_codon:yes gene_type:complete
MKKISLIIVILSLFLTSCGIYKYSPVEEEDYDVEKRVKRNIEQGKGIAFGKIKNKGGTFDFASSNELWRASIETLDFVTFANASYSGGILITDWFNSNSEEDIKDNRDLKITIRFLSNEVRADGLKIIIHERICPNSSATSCSITKIKSNIESEIKLAILKRATELKKKTDSITREKNKNKTLGGEKRSY